MFIHVSEDTVDNDLRSGRTFCKECDNYTTIRLVERVRTVTAFWLLKSSERNHFLICDGCGASFRVKANKREIDESDINTLLAMSGGRYVPFRSRVLMFLAFITVWVPVLGQVLVWMAWRERAVFPPKWREWIKHIFWAGLLFNALFIASAVIDL